MDVGDEYYRTSLHRDNAGENRASAHCLNRVAAAARQWEPLQRTALDTSLRIFYIIQRKSILTGQQNYKITGYPFLFQRSISTTTTACQSIAAQTTQAHYVFYIATVLLPTTLTIIKKTNPILIFNFIYALHLVTLLG